MISLKYKGDFKKTYSFLNGNLKKNYMSILEKYGKAGVDALSAATPIDSGNTSKCWSYSIQKNKDSVLVTWHNSNIVDGVPVAILLQYGHGTSNGGYVQGRDYINPALKHIFDRLADEAWREVIS